MFPPLRRATRREVTLTGPTCQTPVVSAAERLRTAVEARDLDAAVALLAPDVVFRSPIVHQPYQGPEAVRALLEGVMAIFEDFRYERVDRRARTPPITRWSSPPASATARCEGCDFLHENADGQIDEFVVMVRPLTGALALAEAMRAHFEGGGVPAP